MKLIMENWRRWLGLKKDKENFPSDGLDPINPKFYDVHQGGEEYQSDRQLPLLNPPDDHPEGAPIKNRPALSIDHPDNTWPAVSLDKLDRGVQDLRKSDAGYWGRPSEEIISDLAEEWHVQNRELTWLEASNTITQYEADRHRERMADFHEVLAHADTGDVNLMKLKREI